MKASNLSASALRMILIAGLVGLVVLGVVGFLFLRTLLVAQAEDTAAVVSQVENSGRQLRDLKDAERTLNENASVEQKVREMVPLQTSYQYQDAFALNILAIAKKAGINIKNINYITTEGGTAQSSGPKDGVALPGGITSTTANIVFESPLRYDQWLSFVHYIEMNTMRMQIATISISTAGVSSDGHSLINSEGFTIGVYVRNE